MPGTLAAFSSSDARQPITGQQRIQWAVRNSIGPGLLFSAGLGTLFDVPKAYGTHWEGFGERYGIRLTAIAVSNTTEAGLGAIWGEDPRYIPGSNFLSNSWRTDSDATLSHAAIRTGFRFLGRLGTNTFDEFWPDVKQKLLNRSHPERRQP
jgi:hypothetical protein